MSDPQQWEPPRQSAPTPPWQPGASVAPEPDPQWGELVGKDRSPGAVVGLSIITLGFYYLYWYWAINLEIKEHDPDIKVRPGLALLALFFPFANLVSGYSTAARIRQMQLDDEQTQTISPVVALLLLMFLGIGYPLYISSQLREHWHRHERDYRLGKSAIRPDSAGA